MIRLRRGPEPEDLRRARRKHLARAILAWANRDSIVFEGYDVARDHLYAAQHRKCAYCERQPGLDDQVVEHRHPKEGAKRGNPLSPGPATVDRAHYFWLAWTWENLFFACRSCNGQKNKGNWFPLAPGTNACATPPREVVAELPEAWRRLPVERAMLVDPAGEDPMDSIEWRPENPGDDWDRLRWKPFGRDPDKRGDTTIAVVGLLRDLPESVSAHVRAHLHLKMERLRDAVAREDREEAHRVWVELEKMLAPDLPYLAATYDAIQWCLDQPGLRGAQALVGRSLPRPGAVGDDPPGTDIEDPPLLRSLPILLRLQVRAEAWQNAKDAIRTLCAHAPWHIDELEQILDNSKAYLMACCKELEREGQLESQRGPDGRIRFKLKQPTA